MTEVWEPTGAGDHRHISRRPEVRQRLDRLVRDDPTFAERLGGLQVAEQEWGGTGLHYAGTWRETGAAVLLKLGVGASELHWMRWLAAHAPDLVPRLYASGEQLGQTPGLDLCWTVIEYVPYGLGPAWRGDEFTMLLEAGVRFQATARDAPPNHLRRVDRETVRGWLERGLAANPPGPGRLLLDRLADDWALVAAVCPAEICHGDLHLANALTRTPPPTPSQALLIDPAPAIQPWAFDAAWPQVLNSIDRLRVGYTGLVQRMAARREAHGLATCRGPDLERLATVTLGWFAIRAWGLTPGRHSIPDYVDETRRYVEASVRGEQGG